MGSLPIKNLVPDTQGQNGKPNEIIGDRKKYTKVFCEIHNYIRMHSSRMRTARSRPQCMLGYTPLGLGLDTPPPKGLGLDTPAGCGSGHPPLGQTPNLPLGLRAVTTLYALSHE